MYLIAAYRYIAGYTKLIMYQVDVLLSFSMIILNSRD